MSYCGKESYKLLTIAQKVCYQAPSLVWHCDRRVVIPHTIYVLYVKSIIEGQFGITADNENKT